MQGRGAKNRLLPKNGKRENGQHLWEFVTFHDESFGEGDEKKKKMSEYFIDNIGSCTNGKSMVPSLLLEKFHSLEKCFANFGMEIVDANDEVNDGKKKKNSEIFFDWFLLF